MALIALAAIFAITAAWWALALWPVGLVQPEWLARTRAACFGAGRGGLPDAGGWILLVGEPVGMLAALFAGWGASVRRDIVLARSHRVWRIVGVAIVVLAITGTSILGVHVARAATNGRWSATVAQGIPQRLDLEPAAVSLVDQYGRRTALSDFRGRPALLTFAFGHCSTVCPAIVHNLMTVRRTAGRSEVPLVVITLDPWRDTPDRLATIAASWNLEPGDRVLSGSVADVEAALDRLGIGRRRNETTGDIQHGPTAMMLNARGHITSRLDGGAANLAGLLRGAP